LKKKISPSSRGSALRPLQSYPHHCTVTKRSNFVAHIKNQIRLAKFVAIIVPPLFVILLLHFTWSGDGTDRIHKRERKNGCFWRCKILILPKAIQFYLTKSTRGCGCITNSYGTDRIYNSDRKLTNALLCQ